MPKEINRSMMNKTYMALDYEALVVSKSRYLSIRAASTSTISKEKKVLNSTRYS